MNLTKEQKKEKMKIQSLWVLIGITSPIWVCGLGILLIMGFLFIDIPGYFWKNSP